MRANGAAVRVVGTMTWGNHTPAHEARRIFDRSLEGGCCAFDCAEIYPFPSTREGYGESERILGDCIQGIPRDSLSVMTKVAGPGHVGVPGPPPMDWLPPYNERQTLNGLREAVENSLRRLRCDYIDVLFLHWPARQAPRFGTLGSSSLTDLTCDDEIMLKNLCALIEEGKIKSYGLSNETAWGVMRYLLLADRWGTPRPAAVQNPYNLLNRTAEIDLAEIMLREQISFYAYSPLAMGLLSGKYLGDVPADSRFARIGFPGRYNSPRITSAVKAYNAIAHSFGKTLAQVALGFIAQSRFCTAPIIGVTTLQQFEANLGALATDLPAEILTAIDNLHFQTPNPAP